MSSLSQLFAGRKKESHVCDYFNYEEATGKSKCTVIDSQTGAECGINLAGKNATNWTAILVLVTASH